MFRFHKTLDVLTLFHAPKSASSQRVLDLLKAASTSAGGSAGKEKGKGRLRARRCGRARVPTPSQLRSILEFAGKNRVGEIVKGTASEKEAMKALDEGGEGLSERVLRPLLVDWNNGRTVLGADESAIKNLVDTLPK